MSAQTQNAHGPQGTLTITAPATGETVATIPAQTAADLDAVVARAHAAQTAWAADDAHRRECLHRLADLTLEHTDELLELAAQETGKPRPFAAIEPHWTAEHLRWIADAELPDVEEHDIEGEHVRLERVPVGVVGAIIPWNVPVVMAVHKFAAAARMGNTVVIKPSPFTPMATARWVELAQEVLPEGVVQIVVGGDELGEALVSHPGIDMIGFTGSTATGRAIIRTAAETIKPLALELGGNDAAIVLEGTDVEAVAEQIFMGAFLLSGQVCQAIKRLYVHRSVYEELGQALAAIAERQVLGGPDDADATFGPLVTPQQRDRVAELVDDARAHGGRVLCGGYAPDRPGTFYAPTIVMDVPRDTRLVVEEQFGPALPLIPFDDVEDALAWANDSEFGLGGSIWTGDLEEGARLARRLEAGSVWLNGHASIHPAVAFGGRKSSGLGREGGVEGLLSYTEIQTVHLPAGSN